MIKRIRKSKGLTQMQLAKRAKVTQAYIAMLEADKECNPTLNTLKRIAEALDVPLTKLLK